MKGYFQKLQPRFINYRDYRRFQNYAFRMELLSNLLNINLEENGEELSNFFDTYQKILNHHAPCKK